jgi:hypothetical protein
MDALKYYFNEVLVSKELTLIPADCAMCGGQTASLCCARGRLVLSVCHPA